MIWLVRRIRSASRRGATATGACNIRGDDTRVACSADGAGLWEDTIAPPSSPSSSAATAKKSTPEACIRGRARREPSSSGVGSAIAAPQPHRPRGTAKS